jgi:hypothetical protein
MAKRITLHHDEIIFFKGESGTVGVAKFAKNGQIFIGTPDKEEIVMFLEVDDLVAVSALKSGPMAEEGIKSLIFLLRDLGTPLVVLPQDHPTSKDCQWWPVVGKKCGWIAT